MARTPTKSSPTKSTTRAATKVAPKAATAKTAAAPRPTAKTSLAPAPAKAPKATVVSATSPATKPATTPFKATPGQASLGTDAGTVVATELKKKELLDDIVARSDVAKKFARPVLEAALALIGEALDRGENLNLEPLGKVKVNRSKEAPNAMIHITRIRRRKVAATSAGDTGDAAVEGATTDLAQAAE